MRRYPVSVLCASLLFASGGTLRAQQKEQLPVYREAELSGNLYSDSHTPAALWFSPVGEVLDFHMDYDMRRGDLHDVDESSKINGFGAGIAGQQRFDKVVCYGSIGYNDAKEYARRWNSTLQIADDNPFILGDSIPADFNIQRFNLTGTVAWNPAERVILALRLDYDTASSANQTDPRPKTDGMHFVVTPGIHYRLGGGFSLGLSGSFDLMSESIAHEVIDPRKSYVYFRFNGLGDYSTISTGTALSYPRDYTGTEYTGALQLAWDAANGLANLLEATYASNSEKARDGGAAFTFLGGDYTCTAFGISDRLRFGNARRTHNITLGWEHKRVEGIWYDQTAYIDPDKNNQLSYKVQASGLKNKEIASVARVEYRFDRLREGLPTFTVLAAGRLEHAETTHYEADGYNRRYTRLNGSVEASKHFAFGRNRITATLGVQGASALCSSQHVQDRIRAVYTDPAFEYLTATWIGGRADVRYRRLFGKLWAGLYAQASLKRYMGSGNYTDLLENTDSRRLTFGAEILF